MADVSHLASNVQHLEYITTGLAFTLLDHLSTHQTAYHHNKAQHTMGYTTTRRKSSFHYIAETYLGFGFGLARRVSYAERRSSTSTSSSHLSKSKPAAVTYPCYHRIVVPEPCYHSLHNYCFATDATYASLSDRLNRVREHKDDLAEYERERGERKGMGRALAFLREDVERLEDILEEMREKLGNGGSGSGKVFLVGGRWATFL